MKNPLKWILLLQALYFSTSIYSQTGAFYSTDKELSNSLVNSIYQDRRGYIWIATEDGLNKFDGVRFSVYKNRQGDATSIKNNYVRTLFEDKKGRFWIGCINGLLRYDRENDSFREVDIYNGKKLVHPHITSITETSTGELWITANGQGVVHVTKEDERLTIEPILTKKLNSIFLVTALLDNDYLWIATEYQGINRYSLKSGEVKSYQYPLGIGSNQISALSLDKNGDLFVGTLTSGLFRYNKLLDKFDPIKCKVAHSLSIKSLLLDKQNRLLVGTDGFGMMRYDGVVNCLEPYQMTSAPFDFSRMKVHAIFQDRAGNMWTGLFQKGVFLSPNNPNKFNYLGYKSFDKNKIGSSCVMSVLKDRTGQLWIGTDNDGAYAITANGNSRHYAPRKDGLSVSSTVMSMAEDKNGNLWLGSFLDGLAVIDKNSGRCTYYNDKGVQSSENNSNNKVVCLAIDPLNHLWIGTNGSGVYVFDVTTRRYIKHYYLSANGQNRLINDWISSIFCDKEGVVWIGTYEGLNSVNTHSGEIKVYTKEKNNLPGNVIYSIQADKHGNAWIGTTEGLAFIQKGEQIAKLYTTKDGLADNVICGIAEDNQGDIWMSTHTGISKLDISEKRFINYNAQDGLQGNEFSRGAVFKTLNHELIFGGTNGVTSFLPSQIQDHRNIPKLSLTGLYILDKPVVRESSSRQIYNGFIGDAKSIHLDYKDNMFSLEFSTFDFGGSGRVYYRYKVDGLNSQWMNTEKGVHRISFTNLNYGHYKLRVRACVQDTLSEEMVLRIEISPPWYLSWWAKVIYFLLFTMLLYGIVQYLLNKIRYKQELMRIEHAEQINEAKLQFFINISHEIRTPMTLILSPLEKLIREDKNPEKQSAYQMMFRNSQRILRLINQLMDIRKIDKGQMVLKHRETDIISFIDDVMETFHYQAKQRNISFTFNHTESPLNMWLDLNSFDKVLVNILSNAFKFTPDNGEITIFQRVVSQNINRNGERHYCEITVADTGIGIEEDKIERIFERFYQIESAQSKMYSGTGIGLHLAQSLVELLHGKIFARNRGDKQGSEFIILLPLGNSHLNENELDRNPTQKEVVFSEIEKPIPEIVNEKMESVKRAVKTKTNYRVLIVDDEDEIRQYLKQELSPIYRITECRNGKEALELILKEKPNLVISDVMMPEMDGITLCKKLKSNININHIPIVLLTAKSDDEHKSTGFEIGADAYIVKPFNMELLKKRISNLIENRERLEPKPIDEEQNQNLIRQVVIKPNDQKLLEKVIKIINDNLSNSELNVETLADGVGMSRVHMHRKLKELTNQSARDLIRSIRLKQAAELLKNNKLSVSEVAYALGFSNLSHFSNSFREFHGMSPKEYAENHHLME